MLLKKGKKFCFIFGNEGEGIPNEMIREGKKYVLHNPSKTYSY